MSSLQDYWPLFGLALRTPRLVLTPMQDADLAEYVDAALSGVHDPSVMPFAVPWTDAPRDELITSALSHQWRMRCQFRPGDWTIAFAVRADGEFLGVQDLAATKFSLRKTVTSGSWLARRFHRRGYGTEMRAAIVQFAFDHLGAEFAESGAAEFNSASLGISNALGYRHNGIDRRVVREGEVTVEQRVLLDRASFRRPEWTVGVSGIDPVRSVLVG